MILAYHYVAGGEDAMKRILMDGKLVPATARIDPLVSRLRCGDFMATAQGRAENHPYSFDSLEELLDERIDEIDSSDVPEAERTRSETQFHCVDLLAGDLESLFMSIRDWPEWLQDPSNGFAFDASFLIRKGARIRPFDLLEDYESAIWAALVRERGQNVSDFKRIFRSIQKKNELSGRQAVKFVEDNLWGELVFRGEIPVNWANEIWREGVLEWRRT